MIEPKDLSYYLAYPTIIMNNIINDTNGRRLSACTYRNMYVYIYIQSENLVASLGVQTQI